MKTSRLEMALILFHFGLGSCKLSETQQQRLFVSSGVDLAQVPWLRDMSELLIILSY